MFAKMMLSAVAVLTSVASAADVMFTVEGTGFAIRELKDGRQAYGNRDYVWRQVPKRFVGWKFTRTDGGRRSALAVSAKSDGVIHVATAAGQTGVDMTGWQRLDDLRFHYTDKGRTVMTVFRRAYKAPAKLAIPQGNWTGTIVIAPGLKGEAKRPAMAADHSNVPGVILHHSPARSGVYIGCPGIAVLPNGDYVASHSYFGPRSKMNRMSVYRSRDRGKTWTRLTDIHGQWWSSLFVHRGDLYHMGVSRRYGQVVIRRSKDGGKTWTQPKDADSGLLIAEGKYHCAPVPVVVHKGRIWRAYEQAKGRWGTGFSALVLSAPADADLLKADSWTASNRLDWGGWKPYGGWLEGNVVADPNGHVVDILRVHEDKAGGKAAIVNVSDDGRTVSFDPKTGFIDFPGGCKKFTIRFDPATKLYWSLTNYIPPRYRGHGANMTRNTLALTSSADLRKWTLRSVVLRHPDVRKVGFQYVDWLFDGADLIAAVRTAFDDGLGGAHNSHDANYFTFQRITGFRRRSMKDPPLSAGT